MKEWWRHTPSNTVFLAATPHISAAAQSLFRWQVGDVIGGGPFRQSNNTVRVPEEPGLGVELDGQAMRHWAGHFAKHGPMSHFYEPRNPGRYNRLPLY